MEYLIKLGSEITIKSDGVRKQCIRRLKTNIIKHLDYYLIDATAKGNWDRIIIEIADIEDQYKVQEILKYISGIENFSPIISYNIDRKKTSEEIFDNIAEHAWYYFGKKVSGKSFAVRVKRIGKHSFKSTDVERQVGGRILKKLEGKSRVNLEKPDVTIRIDIKNENYSIVLSKIPGVGGYPIGFQGRVLSLVSGGFDSGLATQMMMNRGCEVDYLFFNLGGSAHELGVKQVSHYLWKTFSLSYKRAHFLSVPFEEIVREILLKVDHKYRAIILKRCMLRVASKIAEKHYYYALVKGDSIGQVSSQTLKNLHVIDKSSDTVVLRPLIGMNKQYIMNRCKQIGTFHFASSMPEYCGIISDKPSIGADMKEVLDAESTIDESLLEKAFEVYTAQRVSDIGVSGEGKSLEEVSQQSEGDIIIDIRENERVEKSPLSQKGFKNVTYIPFYDINHSFGKLHQNKTYLLYCDTGVLSHLHGLYLREKGFSNIKVLKP